MINTNPKPYEATVLADSIANGVRLTTLVVKIPRIVLAEFNTHRVFSRNSASSRAIPVKKRIAAIREEPYVPLSFGKNRKGMQSTEALNRNAAQDARAVWLKACTVALRFAEELADLGVHKQLANRIVEPYSWQTVIVTATEWANYWALRVSGQAQPEIHAAAANMKKAMDASEPQVLALGSWHLPLVTQEEIEKYTALAGQSAYEVLLVKLSAARCARVSYLTHGGARDIEEDEQLYDRLRSAGHMSPFEHPAQVGDGWVDGFCGNFRRPWVQHRKMLQGESVFIPGGE